MHSIIKKVNFYSIIKCIELFLKVKGLGYKFIKKEHTDCFWYQLYAILYIILYQIYIFVEIDKKE